MGTVVPMELVRLRSATATYVAILYDSLPALEALVTADPEAEMLAQLQGHVEVALDAADAPGTPGAILTTLSHLLGTEPLAAGALAPAAPPSAFPNASPPTWRCGSEGDDESATAGGGAVR